MDPRGQALKRHAWRMMQFRNGADVAMLNAMLNIGEKLYDRQYVQTSQLATHVKDFTPEEMAPICGIPADTLREVARTYARAQRATTVRDYALSQHTHGTDNACCPLRPGRPGIWPTRCASDAGLIPMFFPDYKCRSRSPSTKRPGARSLDPKKGKTVVEARTRCTPTSQGMYMARTRRCRTPTSTTRAARSPISSIWWCRTFSSPSNCSYADVILPASAWPEKDGTVTNTSQVQMAARRCCCPATPARICGSSRTRPAHGREVELQPCRRGVRGDGAADAVSYNITWERVERGCTVTYPVDGPDVPGRDVVFDKGFPRPNSMGSRRRPSSPRRTRRRTPTTRSSSPPAASSSIRQAPAP